MERNIKSFFFLYIYIYIYTYIHTHIYHFTVIAETNTALQVNCTSIKIFYKTLHSVFHLSFIICLRLDHKDKIQIQHRVMFRHQIGYFSCLRQRNLNQVPCGGTLSSCLYFINGKKSPTKHFQLPRKQYLLLKEGGNMFSRLVGSLQVGANDPE